MRLEEHYLTLRENFREHEENAPFYMTISDIADILNCTERHAKHIMKKLNEEDWIMWETFRGRGKRPRLAFLYTKEEIEQLFVKELIKDGKSTEVIEKLNHFDLHIQEEVEHFFENYFGFAVEQARDSKENLDILRYPLRQNVRVIDPLHIQSRQDYQLIEHIYDTLFFFDAKEKKIVPHLCFYWEPNEDGTQWYFYIRKRVVFHNGKRLNAYDVKYSLHRLDTVLQNCGIAVIESIEVLSTYILKVTLKQPSFLLPHILCDKGTSIVPKDWQPVIGELPVGSGPFKGSYYSEDKVILTAHDQYFHIGPHLDRVELIFVPEGLHETSLKFSYAEMQKEGIDWKPFLQIINGAASFNFRKEGIHQAPSFRKALGLITDLFKAKMRDEVRPSAYSFIYQETHTNVEEDELPHQSRELLSRAGYKGETIHLYVPYLEGGINQQPYAEKYAAFCKTFGINMEIHCIALRDLSTEENQTKADLMLLSFIFEEDIIQSLYVAFFNPSYSIINMVTEERKEEMLQQLKAVLINSNPTLQLEQLFTIERELMQNQEILFLHHLRMKLYHHESDNMAGIVLSAVSGDVHYNLVWYKKHHW